MLQIRLQSKKPTSVLGPDNVVKLQVGVLVQRAHHAGLQEGACAAEWEAVAEASGVLVDVLVQQSSQSLRRAVLQFLASSLSQYLSFDTALGRLKLIPRTHLPYHGS